MATNTYNQDITKYGGSIIPTITSSVLTPKPEPQFVQPNDTPIYPVAGLQAQPEMTATAPEQQANSLTTELQRLNDQLTGQSDYRAQQEQSAGVQQMRQTQTDLNSRLTSLKNEALSIPLQFQQAATGTGVTTAGLQPHQTAALRNNAIQALSTSSLLEASRGNLATALDMVDRAVSQRFDPIKEQLAAKQSNLDLILKSPAYSLAEKNRAQQQQAQLKQAEASLATQQENQKTIQGLALQALQNGAPSAVTDKIMNAPDLASAFAAASGYAQKETAQSIQEYNFAVRNGYTGSYTQYQNEDANRKASVARAGVANGMTTGAPASYKEWELAGKPGSYAQWLQEQNTKAPTTAQQTVATYAVRLDQSIPTIDGLEKSIAQMNPASFETQKRLPSYLQSADFQSFDQAARNFINAVLRRESGAVISPSEFDNAYKQYLPRSGDTATTLEQKRTNRALVAASLKKAAGSAYQSADQLLGTPTQSQADPQFTDWLKANGLN